MASHHEKREGKHHKGRRHGERKEDFGDRVDEIIKEIQEDEELNQEINDLVENVFSDDNEERIDKIIDSIYGKMDDQDREDMQEAIGGVVAIVAIFYACCVFCMIAAVCGGYGVGFYQLLKRVRVTSEIEKSIKAAHCKAQQRVDRAEQTIQ